MATTKRSRKQNVTIRLERKTILKATLIAAQRSTSLGALLTRQIELLVGDDEAYESARQQAMTLLEKGFHLGGEIHVSRDKLHDR